MTTSMIAWHFTMRTQATTSTERERGFPLVCQHSVVSHHPHTHAPWLKLNKFAPFTPSPCAWSSVRSLHLDPPFLLLALSSAPSPLPQVPEVRGKPAQLLQTRVWTPPTSSPSPQVMIPRPTTSTRPLSSPTCSSWTRRRSSPTKSLLRTPTTMTLHSKTCSTKHIERKPITLCEKTCLSVWRRRQCPIERCDPLEVHRGDPVSTETRKHRLGLCSTIKKEQILAECQARINRHEFQAALAEDDQQLLQGQLLQQNLELREAHQRCLTEMEELRKFQSSTFDTVARRKLVEDQNTILELTGRVQELQNEINCMNEWRDFQDAESIRSGNAHVTSRPVSFPPHPIPERMLSRSFGVPSRRERPPSI